MLRRVKFNDVDISITNPVNVISHIIQRKPNKVHLSFTNHYGEALIRYRSEIYTNTLADSEYQFVLKCLTAMEIR